MAATEDGLGENTMRVLPGFNSLMKKKHSLALCPMILDPDMEQPVCARLSQARPDGEHRSLCRATVEARPRESRKLLKGDLFHP